MFGLSRQVSLSVPGLKGCDGPIAGCYGLESASLVPVTRLIPLLRVALVSSARRERDGEVTHGPTSLRLLCRLLLVPAR